ALKSQSEADCQTMPAGKSRGASGSRLMSRSCSDLPRTSPRDAEAVFVSVEDFHEARPLFAAVAVFLNVGILTQDLSLANFTQDTRESNVRYSEIRARHEGLSLQHL